MPKQVIGYITCPECGRENVPVGESGKRQWAHYTCSGAEGCGSQHFARSAKADTQIRNRMKPVSMNLDEDPNDESGAESGQQQQHENHEENDDEKNNQPPGKEKDDDEETPFSWWG